MQKAKSSIWKILLVIIILQIFLHSSFAQKVFKVEYENQADLKIFFVKYESQAGWRNLKKQYILKF